MEAWNDWTKMLNFFWLSLYIFSMFFYIKYVWICHLSCVRCWDDLGCWWTPSQAVWALSIGHGTSRWADGVRKRGADMCGLAPLGFPSFLVFLKAGFGGLKHAFLLESILMWTQIQASILFVKFKLFFFKSELLHVRIWSCCRFSVTLLRCRLSASAHLPECHGVLPMVRSPSPMVGQVWFEDFSGQLRDDF